MHDVLIGTDINDLTLVGDDIIETSFIPDLVLSETYYWQVLETDVADLAGDIWSFSTQEFLVVDDFESYNDIPTEQEGSNLVYLTWIDGYVEPPDVRINGSTIGYTVPFEPSMETSIVYDGSQSAPLYYDNSVVAYSEITAYTANQPSWAGTLPVGPDWSIGGAPATLSIWFYGSADNPATEQMYVKVNGVKATYDGVLTQTDWQEFPVDLASLGIDLSNVTTLTIGFERTGAVGGSGMVFIDDIRLYP